MSKAQLDFKAAKAEAFRFMLSRFRKNAKEQWRSQRKAEGKAK